MTATCGGCPAKWSGASAAHCAACHETFGSAGSFDRHRKAGRCIAPSGVRGLRWSTQRGMWVREVGETDSDG